VEFQKEEQLEHISADQRKLHEDLLENQVLQRQRQKNVPQFLCWPNAQGDPYSRTAHRLLYALGMSLTYDGLEFPYGFEINDDTTSKWVKENFDQAKLVAKVKEDTLKPEEEHKLFELHDILTSPMKMKCACCEYDVEEDEDFENAPLVAKYRPCDYCGIVICCRRHLCCALCVLTLNNTSFYRELIPSRGTFQQGPIKHTTIINPEIAPRALCKRTDKTGGFLWHLRKIGLTYYGDCKCCGRIIERKRFSESVNWYDRISSNEDGEGEVACAVCGLKIQFCTFGISTKTR